ncbi:uncharacterized protein [Anabrus simplex]|uniref:uncharacterized protein isoform X2 n=1 Tax=Anabrus simplex TaxID=316456 RepID=UPI0035A350C5
MIQELLTKISNELKYSHEMDAPPRPLCSVTIKGEPDEIDTDLPFKTSVKTELVDFEETVLHELVPEFPMELKYSPQIYLSAQPFCSVVDTDLSFKSLPRTDVDDLKTEMPDDNSDGNSSNGSSPNWTQIGLQTTSQLINAV